MRAERSQSFCMSKRKKLNNVNIVYPPPKKKKWKITETENTFILKLKN